MAVMREETFGPVAPVRVVPDFDEALLEAAHDDYGLAATVLTSEWRTPSPRGGRCRSAR